MQDMKSGRRRVPFPPFVASTGSGEVGNGKSLAECVSDYVILCVGWQQMHCYSGDMVSWRTPQQRIL